MGAKRAGSIAGLFALAVIVASPASAAPLPSLAASTLMRTIEEGRTPAIDWGDIETEHPPAPEGDGVVAAGFWLVGGGLASTALASVASIPDNDQGLRVVGVLSGAVFVVSGLVMFSIGAARR